MLKLINRFRFLFLFIVLISFFLTKSICMQFGWFKHSDSFFAILIMASIFIIGQRIRLLITIIIILILTIGGIQLLALYLDLRIITALKLLSAIGYLIVMASYCFYFALQDTTISITTLFGPISCYLLIGLIFSNIYLLIEVLSPHSFTGLDVQNEVQAIYFSFITLTTVGFGEIIPLKPIAQTLTWFESFSGQLYIAIIIGQLVGRYETGKKARLSKDKNI
jgi:voltage-gated potassium channel